MLTQLRIRNFKAWQDTGNIRLAPLTVFFGTNSSGKTSLLQFLLMLQQTVQSPDRRRVLNFGDHRSLVDLGVWPEMVFRREGSRTLGFKLWWQSVLQQDLVDSEDSVLEVIAPLLSFEAEVGTLRDGQTSFGLKSFEYCVRIEQELKEFSAGVEYAGGGEYEFWRGGSSQEKKDSLLKVMASLVNFYAIQAGKMGHQLSPKSIRELQDFQNLLEGTFESIRYLGPIRVEPSRLYSWAGDLPEEVGSDGGDTMEAILASRERLFGLGAGNDELTLEAIVARWLQEMGLLESFQLKPIAPNRKEYEVFVRAAGMSDEVNLTDVGFGLSQVLPVLVQLLYVESRSTLLFEQPELHLHPRAQAALADVFIEALQVKEEEENREIQILAESHSEHFLRRLQRRVAENKVTPDQIALYFCKPGPEGSTIEELKLDEYGNISNWPENFFGDEMGDLAAMTKAALERQLAQEGE